MSAWKIAVAGHTWTVANPAAVRAWYESLSSIARPRFVLGCQRCKMLCVIRASDCTCCAQYGTRTNGGAKSHANITGGPGLFNFDPEAKRHVIVMPYSELLAHIADG